uniref:SEA domain-containing protein n=1 Tax=Leptobrachium leishanense TaxID=445787 RepID=A0A8C5N0A5_9ANUR
MKDVYKYLPGYRDVHIKELRSGSVIVDHDVIVEAEYQQDLPITEQYSGILGLVNAALEELKEIECNGTQFCVSPRIQVNVSIPQSETDRCNERSGPGFQEFYEPFVTDTALICVSSCSHLSSQHLECNNGHCQLYNNTGPTCLCSDTDKYLYTSSECRGRILKSGLYGGVGAAIAILVVIIATIVFFLFRLANKKSLDFILNSESSWYEENDNEWSVERGFTNMTEALDDTDRASSSQGSSSARERFKADLENVDTQVVVKIQRPEISTA